MVLGIVHQAYRCLVVMSSWKCEREGVREVSPSVTQVGSFWTRFVAALPLVPEAANVVLRARYFDVARSVPTNIPTSWTSSYLCDRRAEADGRFAVLECDSLIRHGVSSRIHKEVNRRDGVSVAPKDNSNLRLPALRSECT